ncbi:hypothetical protein Tco_1294572 [Tanacetum coccineum]
MGSLQMDDDDDEISNCVDLYMYMLGGGWKWQDLQGLLWWIIIEEEPKRISKALQDDSWVQAMQEELLLFKLQQVWVLVDLPHGMKVIGFIVYQMESDLVKTLHFVMGTIDEEYVADMLKKFDLACVKTTITPMETKMALTKDEEGADVDVNPKVSHLLAMKRIFKYLKSKPNLGFWYPRESPFDLGSFSDNQTVLAECYCHSLDDGTLEIKATIDTIEYTITEPSIRRQEPPSVTQPQPSSSVVPPTPPSTQPIPSKATAIPPFSQPAPPTPIAEATNASPSPTPSPAHILEVALKRKTKRALLFDSEEEEIEAFREKYKRRKSSKEFAGMGLDFEEVKSAFEEVNTGGIKVSGGIKEINAGSLNKKQAIAESYQLDALEKALKRRVSKQVHLDSLLAQRMAEEQELTEEQKKRKAQVQFEA